MTRRKPSKTPVKQPAPQGGTPLIFISHDSRDGDFAEAFEILLSDASAGVLKCFRSSDRRGTSGIEFGAEWYTTIMARLAEATDVVALLTPRSLGKPWILYEIGVARGRLATTTFGVAVGVSLDQVDGPFAQFQNSADDEESLTKLVMQLIRRIPGSAPRADAVSRHVVAFRDRVANIGSAPARKSQPPDAVTIAKLFEEVKIMFRSLPEDVAQRLLALEQRGQRLSNAASAGEVDDVKRSWPKSGGDLRKEADAAFDSGDFSAAVQLYQKLFGEGEDDSELLFRFADAIKATGGDPEDIRRLRLLAESGSFGRKPVTRHPS